MKFFWKTLRSNLKALRRSNYWKDIILANTREIITNVFAKKTLLKESPYSEIFWSSISYIRTEYEDLQIKSPYSVRKLENTDQKISKYGHFLWSDNLSRLNRVFFVSFQMKVFTCNFEFRSKCKYVNLKMELTWERIKQ